MDEQATIKFLAENDEKSLELLLQLTNRYLDMQAAISQQKRIISMQGTLINQCMERIMTLEKVAHMNMDTIEELLIRIQQLEGRSILGDFNQRLEILEANKGKMYEVSKTEFSRMLENTVKRVDELEGWLYTHDYAYFQEQEKQQGIADNVQLEETGTHPPNCRCAWCEPQEGMIERLDYENL